MVHIALKSLSLTFFFSLFVLYICNGQQMYCTLLDLILTLHIEVEAVQSNARKTQGVRQERQHHIVGCF